MSQVGEHAKDFRMRRCGWGLAALHKSSGSLAESCVFQGGFAGTLAGSIQTPNRACLEAMVFLLKHTFGLLVVKPDAAYLVNGIEKQRPLLDTGVNADL